MTRAELEALAVRVDTEERERGPDACWPWHTGKMGRMWVGGRIQKVSRLVLAMKLGRPIRPGMFACHTCDNAPCFNPRHLYEGTHRDNMRDMRERRRSFGATQPERARLNGIASGRKNNWTGGERNPKAVLTAPEVAAIRASSAPNRDLANLYEVDITTIQRIKRGTLWRNV